ncbi:MAG: hypothetical protein BWY85_01658 [Firmicutes bacterium ADurb.Bin506]|nr:MAG: hypothetical protein BWY85_01658 [Firmicutes bacterium ADurb.Bin506]
MVLTVVYERDNTVSKPLKWLSKPCSHLPMAMRAAPSAPAHNTDAESSATMNSASVIPRASRKAVRSGLIRKPPPWPTTGAAIVRPRPRSDRNVRHTAWHSPLNRSPLAKPRRDLCTMSDSPNTAHLAATGAATSAASAS